jgi:hypothetical protein
MITNHRVTETSMLQWLVAPAAVKAKIVERKERVDELKELDHPHAKYIHINCVLFLLWPPRRRPPRGRPDAHRPAAAAVPCSARRLPAIL